MATGIGPDGLPAVFEAGGWVSHDRRYRWDGAAWTPLKRSVAGPWFMRAGVVIMFLALAGYVVYTIVSNQAEFTAGFYLGVIAFFATVFVIYRAVGRWGWFGIVIRAGAIGLALIKILTVMRHLPPA